MSCPFQPNEVYELAEPGVQPCLIRVIHTLGDGREVAVINLDRPEAFPVWRKPDELGKFASGGRKPDPWLPKARATSELSQAEKDAIAGRWRTIEPLVSDPELPVLLPALRPGLVNETASRLRVGKSSILNNLRRWWRAGQFRNALVPDLARCGGKGKVRVPGERKLGRDRPGADPRVGVNGVDFKTLILSAVPLLKEGHSLAQARRDVLYQHFVSRKEEDGRPAEELDETGLPTIDQFRYWVGQELDRGEIARERMGEVCWRKDYAPKAGTLTSSVSGAGALYEMDAHVCDIMLRSARNPDRLVGKPILYIVTDVATGLIVGFTVFLGNPSVRQMRLALENAMTDKVAFCASLGIKITDEEWPARHRPGRMLTDGGPEVTSEFIELVALELGFSVSTAPPYTPTWKGLCEGIFALLKVEWLNWAPGAYRKRERGDKPCPLDAKYDLAGFRKAMVLWILEHNLKRSKRWPKGWVSPDGRDPTLLEKWRFSCVRNGAPATIDPELVRVACLERAAGRLSQEGLKHNKRLYYPTERCDLDLLCKLPGGRFGSLKVRYDARDIGEILVERPDGTKSVWRLHDHFEEYAGQSEEEFEDDLAWKASARRKADALDIVAQGRWRTEQQSHAAQVVASMGNIKAVPGPDGIRANRRAEILQRPPQAAARVPPLVVPDWTAAAVSAPKQSFALDVSAIGDDD